MSNTATIQITGSNAPLKAALAQSFSLLKTFGTTVAGSFAGFAIFGAVQQGLHGVAHFIGEAIEKAEEFEKSMIKFDTVLENTGNKTGFSRRELEEFNKEMQKTTIYSGSMSRAAETAFLKMENIRGDVFKRGLTGAANLAAFLDTELPHAADLLSRALQNPEVGMLRLRRAGIILTVAENKRIKELQEGNKLMEAQAALLDIVEHKFGGLAAKLAGTYGGQLKQFNNEISVMQRQLGEQLMPELIKLLPALKDLTVAIGVVTVAMAESVGTIARWIDWIVKLNNETGRLLEKILTLGGALGDLPDPTSGGAGQGAGRPQGDTGYWGAYWDTFKTLISPLAGVGWGEANMGYAQDRLKNDPAAIKRRQEAAERQDIMKRNLQGIEKAEQQSKPGQSIAGTIEGLTDLWKRIFRRDEKDATTEAVEAGNELNAEALAESKTQTDVLTNINANLIAMRGGNGKGNLADA